MRPADTSMPGWGGLLFLAALCTGTALIHITTAGILLVGFLFGILWLHVVKTNHRLGQVLCAGAFSTITILLWWSLFNDNQRVFKFPSFPDGLIHNPKGIAWSWRDILFGHNIIPSEETGQKLGLALILISIFWLVSLRQQTPLLRITFLTIFLACLWILLPPPMIVGVGLIILMLDISARIDHCVFVHHIRNTTQRLFASLLLGAGMILLIGTSVPWPHIGAGGIGCCYIEKYALALHTVDHTAGQFRVHETVQLGQSFAITETRQLTFPPYTVESRPLGIFLREVRVHPLKINEDGTDTATSIITATDGFVMDGSMVFSSDADVTIYDLPRNAFFAARDVTGSTTSYVYTETASWEGVDPLRGVTFAYLAPPFHRVRFLLEPFLRIAAFGDFVVWILGVLGTAVLLPLGTALRDRVVARLSARKEPHQEAVTPADAPPLLYDMHGNIMRSEASSDRPDPPP